MAKLFRNNDSLDRHFFVIFNAKKFTNDCSVGIKHYFVRLDYPISSKLNMICVERTIELVSTIYFCQSISRRNRKIIISQRPTSEGVTCKNGIWNEAGFAERKACGKAIFILNRISRNLSIQNILAPVEFDVIRNGTPLCSQTDFINATLLCFGCIFGIGIVSARFVIGRLFVAQNISLGVHRINLQTTRNYYPTVFGGINLHQPTVKSKTGAGGLSDICGVCIRVDFGVIGIELHR